MTIEYEFINVDTNLATQVFITNTRWQKPAQACSLEPIPESQFFYTPWQFLNASQGAREYFASGESLSIVARTVGPADDGKTKGTGPERCSVRTPVRGGGQYLIFPGLGNAQVVRLGTEESDAVAVTTAPSCVNPYRFAIDWYLGESRIGITEPLPPRVTALFQTGERLMFQATEADIPPQRYTPGELSSATSYKAPSYARQVKVTFQKGAGREAGYSFSPPSGIS